MKILFFTDTHVRKTAPKNRLDNYYESIMIKLNEVIEYANDNDVDYIIHGGDLFERPDVSVATVSEVAQIFMKSAVPIYVLSGNHDIYGYNQDTLNRTMLGLLINLNILKLIPEEGLVLSKDGIDLCLIGKSFKHDMDLSPKNYIINRDDYPKADFYITIAHGFLTDKPFLKTVPHILIDDVLSTEADITLTGHYHTGYDIKYINNKYFANPGSMARVSNSIIEMKRIPSFILIDFKNGIDIKKIPLKTAKSGEEVLDREFIQTNRYKTERMHEFIETIDSSMNLDKFNLYDLITEITNSENFDEKVKDEAMKRIAIVQSGDSE